MLHEHNVRARWELFVSIETQLEIEVKVSGESLRIFGSLMLLGVRREGVDESFL